MIRPKFDLHGITLQSLVTLWGSPCAEPVLVLVCIYSSIQWRRIQLGMTRQGYSLFRGSPDGASYINDDIIKKWLIWSSHAVIIYLSAAFPAFESAQRANRVW